MKAPLGNKKSISTKVFSVKPETNIRQALIRQGEIAVVAETVLLIEVSYGKEFMEPYCETVIQGLFS